MSARSSADEATLATGGPDAPRSEDARPTLINAGHADIGGRADGGRLFFIGEGLELGRRPAAPPGGGTWYIPDGRVSSRHARITRQGRLLHIADLGSRNGTFVDNRRITEPVPLIEGSLVMIGRQAAVVRWLTDEQVEAIADEMRQPFGPVVAIAPTTAVLLRRLRRLAPTDEEVLLTGETGVGKEVYARALHAASGRGGPFVALNCAALPVELVESELFGHARGAHSQARDSRPGLIEKAEGGTLLLDEIGDMPPGAQAKLLRFLQTRSYHPLGAGASRQVNVRVIAATTRPTQDGDGHGLRPDLAGRLGAEPLVIPPLRARREDIGALVAFFLAAGSGRPGPRALDGAAFSALLGHSWPQNVRELEKVVRQAALFAQDEGPIGLEHLPLRLQSGRPPEGDEGDEGEAKAGRRVRRPMPDREALIELLVRYRGNVAEVARHLDRHWGVVQRSLAKHAIDADEYRSEEP
jgi:DNA-binding NtrC family response regulator